MITRDDLLSCLGAVDDRFRKSADRFLAEWIDYPDPDDEGLPYYIVLGEISSIIVEDIRRRNTTPLQEAFALIERLHLDGDRYVREAATIGMLEVIQHQLDPSMFRLAHPYLGGESRKMWDELILFWERVRTPLNHG